MSDFLPEKEIIQRIEEYLRKCECDEDKYFNPAKHFIEDFYVGINQKIHDKPFHDKGREKPFMEFMDCHDETMDRFYETTVSDPQNDEVIREFISSEIDTEFKKVDSREVSTQHEFNKSIQDTSKRLIKKVIDFFGGLENVKERERICEETIQRIRKENGNNIVNLGQLKDIGLCRHRSVLYKVLCDHLGIDCRILRGWVLRNDQNIGDHMWNEIVLDASKPETPNTKFIVDCNYRSDFVVETPGVLTYHNLGKCESYKKSRFDQMTVDNVKEDYENKKGDQIGTGGMGVVFPVHDVDVIVGCENEDSENETFFSETKDLSVKEVNIDNLNVKLDKKNSKRFVEKEVEIMKLLQKHPNIINIYGSFMRSTNEENIGGKIFKNDIFHIVMEKYQFDGRKFAERLKRIIPLDYYRPYKEKRATEVLIFLLEIAKGLRFIHSFGLIHFDIKPSNILMNWKNGHISDVVVTDFGSCKRSNIHFLLTTLILTTKQFAPPEIRPLFDLESLSENEKIIEFTRKIDIYAFGLLMEKFREFYEGFSFLHQLQRQCLLENPTDRPSLGDLMYHLKSSLQKLRRKLYRKCKIEVSRTFLSSYLDIRGLENSLKEESLKLEKQKNEFETMKLDSITRTDRWNVEKLLMVEEKEKLESNFEMEKNTNTNLTKQKMEIEKDLENYVNENKKLKEEKEGVERKYIDVLGKYMECEFKNNKKVEKKDIHSSSFGQLIQPRFFLFLGIVVVVLLPVLLKMSYIPQFPPVSCDIPKVHYVSNVSCDCDIPKVPPVSYCILPVNYSFPASCDIPKVHYVSNVSCDCDIPKVPPVSYCILPVNYSFPVSCDIPKVPHGSYISSYVYENGDEFVGGLKCKKQGDGFREKCKKQGDGKMILSDGSWYNLLRKMTR